MATSDVGIGEKQPSALKKNLSNNPPKSQRSILGFFQKKPAPSGALGRQNTTTTLPIGSPKKKFVQQAPSRVGQNLTPAPSSDAIEEEEDEDVIPIKPRKRGIGLPSPVTPAGLDGAHENGLPALGSSSPIRKGRKSVSYAEAGSEEDGTENDSFQAAPHPKKRLLKRRKTTEESEDNFSDGQAGESEEADEDDFVVNHESEEEKPARKRKRSTPKETGRKSPPPEASSDEDLELPATSTATQWTYDPENPGPLQPRSNNIVKKRPESSSKKQKAHMKEPQERLTWLANIMDADLNKPDSPDYDPRTIYVPPGAWNDMSPFEKQYWEIKRNLWDTVVFFKKGKFYELYENDATIGHQLFDLKLTDRVNMRMVGVPEMSLDHWANQFVAKGYKIARVDQKETALGKEMRERDGGAKVKKENKVIHRELACVLTAGTLVEGGMLQDDMATYCVSIKETHVDEIPVFGIAFVDAATGQFFLSEFTDDVDLTRFETFIAQTRPQELLLEKSAISTKALRILKNNTGPTTLWNYLKPGKEFWEADRTRREIELGEFFSPDDNTGGMGWPRALADSKDKDALMSALGALISYLKVLKIEKDLVSLGNFSWYDPIRKATSLVLDGQTLINLEIFANSFDGGVDGTLFLLLNRCVTPFGKRMFKQWICHPLADSQRINARLDAVDALNADLATRDLFTSSLAKMPDLERLISRIHAGSCKSQDFVRVLEGFEQIDYTMTLVGEIGTGDGLLGQLFSSMPDLRSVLNPWKAAFDHKKAKEHGLLVPEPGVEEDFDQSQSDIDNIHKKLDNLLKKARKDLGSSAIVYRDNGKEVFQLEIPIKVKGVPSNWSQMSATKAVKRYYSPELKTLVRELQEAQETHGQIAKDVARRFYERFDENYLTWLAAIKVVAQLDCLMSLAKASSALGEPCCRPTFVEDDRSVLEFEDLRHPCMLPNVMDFIPNDVKLGGESANMNVLTGANAAGKSTILRMTCVAVIMAQIGCYVPCSFARLSPVDRIMSRLGANDNIFAAQSTFFVELSETKKILSEATPRSLVILDELGRGTSSYDGVAVAQAVLHHIATHIGCIGFFATHYHSLAEEFKGHPEILNKRMRIHVDEVNKKITFLYKLEDGIAEGSFGMHCAAMCGISSKVIAVAEKAAKEWEHTSRLKESLDVARSGSYVPLGVQSDVSWLLKAVGNEIDVRGLEVLRRAIEKM